MSAIKNILLFVLGFVGALFLWSVVEIFLPHAPKIFVNIKKEFLYFDIDLRRIFSKTKPQIVTNRYDTLQNFTLKAVYQNDGRGFVVLEKNKKTYFVDLNKSINGYKLVKINQNSAVFEKNSKKYILTFKKIKTPKIYNVPDVKTIKKETLENYKRNLAKVWKEIGIIKTKNGYLVTYVKPKSIFDKLGLKKGDYILEINDIPLKSDADAWRAYNSIDNFNQIDLTIKRNYQIKVLHYEID
ncbi:PDZ domain-containing protein [Caminibacter pacificus]